MPHFILCEQALQAREAALGAARRDRKSALPLTWCLPTQAQGGERPNFSFLPTSPAVLRERNEINISQGTTAKIDSLEGRLPVAPTSPSSPMSLAYPGPDAMIVFVGASGARPFKAALARQTKQTSFKFSSGSIKCPHCFVTLPKCVPRSCSQRAGRHAPRLIPNQA